MILSLTAPAASGAAEGAGKRVAGTVDTLAGPGFCPGSAVADSVSLTVRSLAADADRRVFFDTGVPDEGLVARVEPDGETSLLRTGLAGGPAASDIGSGTNYLSRPGRLASNGAGSVLVAADTRVVEVDPGVETVAGDIARRARSAADLGDSGPATDASFFGVRSIATDSRGNLYVADGAGDGRASAIRFVNRGTTRTTLYAGTPEQIVVAPGHIATIAGVPGPANAGDGGPARRAVIVGEPPSLALSGDLLYIGLAAGGRGAGGDDVRVRVVNLGAGAVRAHAADIDPAAIATVAGGPRRGLGGDGGPALSAAFSALPGLSADDSGNLFVADHGNDRIRRVDSQGVITTFAGGTGSPNNRSAAASTVRLERPVDVKATGGLVYIADQGNGLVRVVDGSGVLRTAPGAGVGLSWRCRAGAGAGEAGGGEPRGESDVPRDVAVDRAGRAYLATEGGRVHRLDGPGLVTTVFGGTRPPGELSRPPVVRPRAVAASAQGGLYMLDRSTRTVRLANLGERALRAHNLLVRPGQTVTLLGAEGSAGSRSASIVELSGEGSLELGPAGSLFVADVLHGVLELDARGELTHLLSPPTPPDDTRCCSAPTDVAVTNRGDLYVNDALSNRVWFLNRSRSPVSALGQLVPGGALQPVAGTGTRGFAGDEGPATEAQFLAVRGISLGPDGSLYVADSEEHTVRRIEPNGTIRTVMGSGRPGFNGDALKGTATALNTPMDVAVDRCGNLLVVDSSNSRLRRLAGTSDGSCAPLAAADSPSRRAGRGGVVAGVLAAGVLAAAVGLAFRRRRGRRRANFRR